MSINIIFNNNDTKQVEQAVKLLVDWLGEPIPNSEYSLRFLTLEQNSSEINEIILEREEKIENRDEFLIISQENEILFLSVGEQGLANGIYYFTMKLKEKQIKNPFSIEWNIYETPYFETRGIGLFNLPFGLETLSTETWRFDRWKKYWCSYYRTEKN